MYGFPYLRKDIPNKIPTLGTVLASKILGYIWSAGSINFFRNTQNMNCVYGFWWRGFILNNKISPVSVTMV